MQSILYTTNAVRSNPLQDDEDYSSEDLVYGDLIEDLIVHTSDSNGSALPIGKTAADLLIDLRMNVYVHDKAGLNDEGVFGPEKFLTTIKFDLGVREHRLHEEPLTIERCARISSRETIDAGIDRIIAHLQKEKRSLSLAIHKTSTTRMIRLKSPTSLKDTTTSITSDAGMSLR